MISLQALLLAGWREKLPTILMIVGAIIVACVFIVGMVKGFSRISKGAIVWGIVSVGFILLYKFIKNPLANVMPEGFLKDNSQVVWAVLLVLAVVLVVMIARAALGAIFAPADREIFEDEDEPVIKRRKRTRAHAQTEGYEYELDDETEAYYTRSRTRYERARQSSPGILARLLGGICAVINFAIVLAVIATIGLLILEMFNLFGGVSGLAGQGFADFMSNYVFPYVFDAITVGIVFGIACHGFYAGTVGFTRTLLMKIGMILVVIAGLAAPFIDRVNDWSLIDGLIRSCASLFDSIEKISPALLGQITAGVLLALGGAIIVFLVSFLLGKLMDVIDSTIVLRVIDGVLATVIYLALGLVLCFVLWGGLYCLDATGIVAVKGWIAEGSFSLECFETAGKYLGDFVDKYLMKFA